ncbi:MAG: ABC transporter ATP-binding protein, partial [Rhodobacteraceae bacterium]|nr:ABC transporter ATP-binding protein [Paracoccaceae bacterium]
MAQPALDIEDLVLEFGSGTAAVRALDGVTLSVPEGSILGIVGESGSGKSTVGFAAGRLMPEGVRPRQGRLDVLGNPVWDIDIGQMRDIRRKTLRYVFQDPIATLDPTKRIGWQLKYAFEPNLTDDETLAALSDVGLPDPRQVMAAWPHELSGGMAQRVVIAMALLGDPKIIVADEATSALDASVRIRVLELLRDQSRKRGITLLLLSHDLWAVRKFCENIAVMYGGRIVEHGPAAKVFARPAHPYTLALLGATAGHEKPNESLNTIPGIPPLLHGASPGCAFEPRCELAAKGRNQNKCSGERPVQESVEKDWSLLCHHWR